MKYECTVPGGDIGCIYRKPVPGTSFCLDICKHYEKPSKNERPSQCRYQPASKKPELAKRPWAKKNKDKYLQLHNGDIYCVANNMILDRLVLLGIIS